MKTWELAVVAAVIGVLAAIIPAFNGEMAWGFLVLGSAPLLGKLLRSLKAPLPLCVAVALAAGLAGAAYVVRGAQISSEKRSYDHRQQKAP